MFSTSGLFHSVPCPDAGQCKRAQCIFSHLPGARQPHLPHISLQAPSSSSMTPIASTTSSGASSTRTPATPSKRPAHSSSMSETSNSKLSEEPPRKFQKLDLAAKKPTNVSTPSVTSTGVPILSVNAAQSQVAIPVRQAMIKTLFEHFSGLYSDILPSNPSIAAEHALAQEKEVYSNSTKLTYRNAVISSVAALKKRSKPDSISHDSVGTEGSLQRRKEQQQSLRNLQVSRNHLASHILSVDDMKKWGYVTEIPDGPGGDNPSEEGKIKTCERCAQQFMVKRKEDAEECVFHWGKPYSGRINGEKVRIYKCCSRPISDGGGCSRGPHVFFESDPVQLHARHAFTHSRPVAQLEDVHSNADTALDVVAMDCEMIYSTGGMRVARVSVVDGSGKEVFDELVKMDDGVEVIDFNTRFSGINEESYSSALLPLASIRRALDAYINSQTVIVGHSLENDLKTLRMIHHCCVDTAVLFPHRSGPPYRRALRELVREHLNEIIQAGGEAVGHSSVEDSIATLNLLRWFILNNKNMKQQVAGFSSTLSVI